MDPVDPEFLAALPEELQQEVLESRRRDIQQRRNAREREEAQRVRTSCLFWAHQIRPCVVVNCVQSFMCHS